MYGQVAHHFRLVALCTKRIVRVTQRLHNKVSLVECVWYKHRSLRATSHRARREICGDQIARRGKAPFLVMRHPPGDTTYCALKVGEIRAQRRLSQF
jgi:hypothetical protein